MKRLVSISLFLILFLCCVFPVSASSSDISTSNFINITSFCENRKFSLSANSSATFSFVDLPIGDYVYIDAIVYSGSPLTSTNSQLDIINISGNYYRIYGFNSSSSSSSVSFTLKNTNSTTLFLYKCSASTSNYVFHRLNGGVYASNLIGSEDRDYTTSPDDTATVSISNDVVYPDLSSMGSYYSFFYASDSYKYDYIDLVFTLRGIYSLDSIIVKSNNGNVFPFTINYVSTDNGSVVYPNLAIDSTYILPLSHSLTISLRIDLSGFQRINNDDYIPFVICRGQRLDTSISNYMDFTLNSAIGYIDTTGFSTLDLFLFRISNFLKDGFSNLSDKLSSLISGSSQDQSAADSFNDSIDDQSNELEDLTGDLNSVSRPPITDVNLSSSGMVDSGTIVLATSGLGSIMSNTIIVRVLLMALTFALAGFILFGKR